jgi:hypothetical protein
MKKTLTQTYVTHNAKDKTYEEFFNAMERDNFMTAQEALGKINMRETKLKIIIRFRHHR